MSLFSFLLIFVCKYIIQTFLLHFVQAIFWPTLFFKKIVKKNRFCVLTQANNAIVILISSPCIVSLAKTNFCCFFHSLCFRGLLFYHFLCKYKKKPCPKPAKTLLKSIADECEQNFSWLKCKLILHWHNAG